MTEGARRVAHDLGLCSDCASARQVTAARGSRFLRCERSETDPRYPRYPTLPVRQCAGFVRSTQSASSQPTAEHLGAPPLARLDSRVQEVETPEPETLITRIGGRDAVARVIGSLYDRIEADPEIRPLFPADLEAGRAKQKLFFEQWLGGEPRYTQRYGSPRLRQRHLPFPISLRRAERWLNHMRAAMHDCGVAKEVAGEIMEALRPLARHFVNQPLADPASPVEGDTAR